MRIVPLACLLGAALSFLGCASGQQAGSAASSMIPAPASGTAWRVVGGSGSLNAQGTVAPGTTVVSVDGSGAIRASIPASAETQQAAAILTPESFGALQVRTAR